MGIAWNPSPPPHSALVRDLLCVYGQLHPEYWAPASDAGGRESRRLSYTPGIFFTVSGRPTFPRIW